MCILMLLQVILIVSSFKNYNVFVFKCRYVAVAHMNLGLIFMLKMENHYEAIRRFTSAIKIDPTCNRAYVCRAEAYNKVYYTVFCVKPHKIAIMA